MSFSLRSYSSHLLLLGPLQEPGHHALEEAHAAHGEPMNKQYNCQHKPRSPLTAYIGLLPISGPAWHSVKQATAQSLASSSRRWEGEWKELTMPGSRWILQSDLQAAFTNTSNLLEHLHSPIMSQYICVARSQSAVWSTAGYICMSFSQKSCSIITGCKSLPSQHSSKLINSSWAHHLCLLSTKCSNKVQAQTKRNLILSH